MSYAFTRKGSPEKTGELSISVPEVGLLRMKERRVQERRSFDSTSPFVYRGSNGHVIRMDRRRLPDRRLNNISLEMLPVEFVDIPALGNHIVKG